jgi:hypothetical protein
MSEKIYACLLRLYPARFRAIYGEEALQLFRDRARDEQGFFRALRLWADLLRDLAASVPRAYRNPQPATAAAAARRPGDAMPSFQMLGSESPRPGALFSGCALSVALAAAVMSAGRAGRYDSFSFSGSRAGTAADAPSSRARTNQPGSRNSTKGSASQAPPGATPDAAVRHRVLNALIANLKQHYVDANAASKIADALKLDEKSGAYDSAGSGADFASLLTRRMREVSHDPRLVAVYSETLLPERPGPPPGATERYRAAMKQQNCTFEQIEILRGGIGYLKLNSFPDPAVCRQAAVMAMAKLNAARALIFDLRDNRGGYPDMVSLIAAYLFDHPEYLYNPRENTTSQSWTHSPVAGNRLADKPVYIVTSAITFSGAEQFAWDLKMLKRATIVGEKTGGASHSGVFHRLDDHFGMGIPETAPINPFSQAGWEGTGVEPDVPVKAGDALKRAETLARSRLR